jgi:ectoine hydroxylase-related dioxygenase (phytanoyl-CoA dioxygenase family)
MDERCLQHLLSDEERLSFESQGYLVIKDALPEQMVGRLEAALKKVEAKRECDIKQSQGGRNCLDVIGEDELLLELIDWPTTFPKVWGSLGWHIALYHSHYIVTPPLPKHFEKRRLGWHQDSGRINLDIESDPRPRISVKVGFFITDTSTEDRGNFHVIPGSHLTNQLVLPDDENKEHPDAIPVRVSAGDAVMFDRRIWHASGLNFSDVTRRVLFFGYSYRWLKPRDNMTVAHYMDTADPIRRQLLGASPNGGFGYTSPADEDVPLKVWLEQHQLA